MKFDESSDILEKISDSESEVESRPSSFHSRSNYAHETNYSNQNDEESSKSYSDYQEYNQKEDLKQENLDLDEGYLSIRDYLQLSREDSNRLGDQTRVTPKDRNLYSETYGSKYLSEYLEYHPQKAKQLANLVDHSSRKKKLEEFFPENTLKSRLSVLETTQISIEGFANSVVQYTYPPGPLLQLLLDVFVSLPINASSVRLAIFYVYNHLIQTLTNENIWKYPVSFHYTGLETFCIPAIIHTNKIKCNNIIHICNCINIWRQRLIYTKEVCDRLENISTNTSIIKNESEIQHNFNVNDELGYLNTLYYIFKIPFVDKAYQKAVSNCDVERLINCDQEKDKEYLEEIVKLNKEEEFNEVGRLSGQELMILNSSCLDLGALIKENDQNFVNLKREIDKLNALLNRK